MPVVTIPQAVTNEASPRLIYAELRPFAEDTTLIISPTGAMYQVEAPLSEVERTLELCDGRRTLAEILADTTDPAEFAEILAVLSEDNCLSYQPPYSDEADWGRFQTDGLNPEKVASTHILLLGEASLLMLVQEFPLLSKFATVTKITVDDLAADTLIYNEPEQVIVIALCQHLDPDFLTQVDNLCHQVNLRWVPFHLDQGQGWLGPLIIPGYTANYHDLLLRRSTTADDKVLSQALMSPPVLPDQGASNLFLPSQNELRWLLALFFTEIERWVAGAPCRLVSTEICADPLTFELTTYPLLPFPDRRLEGELQISVPKDTRLLINKRSGIITDLLDIPHHPSIPELFKVVQARLAQNPHWYNDLLSMTSLVKPTGLLSQEITPAVPASQSVTNPLRLSPQVLDFGQVPLQVILDAAKYYCDTNFYHAETVKASYNELIGRGDHAVDPTRLILFSDKMYQTPGCPFVPFSQDLPVYWVKGGCLSQSQPAWLPASMVYVNWQLASFVQEETPAIHGHYFPGLAAGLSLEEALAGAIEDIIRRDIMMVWWLNAQPLPAIIQPPELAALWHGVPADLGQRARLIYLPNEFDLPVIAGVLENTQEDFLTIGFGYGPDPLLAALTAWSEASTSQEASRDMNDPNGLTLHTVAQGLQYNAFKPWREDRAYMDDYRPDFKDMIDPLVQRQFYLDPRAIERVRPWLDTPPELTLADLPQLPDRSLSTYQKRVEARGYEIFWMDVTPSDVAQTGIHVVRVIIPGLTPNFPAAFPPTGGGRVQHLPVQLGWRDTPLAEEELNYMPLPGA